MTADPLTILYDGACPFCASYVRMARLRATVGQVELVDARSGDPRVGEALAAGLDLDEGMVVLWQGKRYHGVEAVHLLALLSGEGGLGNWVQRWLFGKPRRAALVYPWLVRGRRAWLRLAGRAPIAAGKKSVPSRE
ncbi:thiol-disulfide oxidoreductase DCC family protein [Rhodosalinus sp. 5P4]|uniref:thiol-disulfide oxidoreductase DCC family protein n=1 Tax=Rhodosalinus sp. 5P4 TaxID=3239196 RepID=UPI0035243606